MDPLDARAPPPALLDHPLREFDAGDVEARFGERDRQASGPCAPFHDWISFALCQREPERDIVVVGIFEVVEVG
jgi:hypothetical protein